MPERIQRKRTKGWRKPPGAIDCTRSSFWGNPFRIGRYYVFTEHYCKEVPESESATPGCVHISDAAAAVAAHKRYLSECSYGRFAVQEARKELKGHDLMCWCPLVDKDGPPHPCHVDTWLDVANSEDP